MSRTWSLILAPVLALTGCAVEPALTPIPPPNLVWAVTATSLNPTSPVASTSPAATVSPIPPVTRIIVLQSSPPAYTPAPPPVSARTATASTRTGWRTYTSTSLHLAVDYPPDWTVRTQDSGAIFTSPQGIAIQLSEMDPRTLNPSDEVIEPNTRCSETVNSHGILLRVCRSTIGFSLAVYLDLKSAGGREMAAAISTGSRGAFDILDALVESARIAP